MVNLSPNDKKLLVLILLIFVVIFAIVIIDFVLNFSMIFNTQSKVEPSNWDKAVNEAINSPKNTRSSIIRTSLNEIFELMNTSDYESLFSLLSDDFKENLFKNNFNSFCEFMNTYSTERYSPYFTEYKKYNNTYMILVSFVPYSNSDEDIINTKNPSKSDTFFITYDGDNNYKFSFLNYVGEKKLGTGVENSQFKVILDKTVLYKTKSEFHFTITNNTDIPIILNNKEVSCTTGVKPRYYLEPIYVEPNSAYSFCFTVNTGLSIEDAVPNQILFNDVFVNGNSYSFAIATKFCLDI